MTTKIGNMVAKKVAESPHRWVKVEAGAVRLSFSKIYVTVLKDF